MKTGSFIGNPSLEDLPVENFRWMLNFWNRLRGTRRMPARADFSPTDMVPMLPFISLMDFERGPQRFKMRLLGTGIVAASGVDLTGKYYDELENMENLTARCTWIAENRQPFYADGLPLDWASIDFSRYAVLSMPLSCDDEDVDMMMSYITFE